MFRGGAKNDFLLRCKTLSLRRLIMRTGKWEQGVRRSYVS
jgi:hypothetical protein